MNTIRPGDRRGLAEGLKRGHVELLTPAEVAQAFRVDPKTVTRWAIRGLLPSVRTLGGHRRYIKADVDALISGERPWPPAEDPS